MRQSAAVLLTILWIAGCTGAPRVGSRYCVLEKDTLDGALGQSLVVDDVRSNVVYVKQRSEYAETLTTMLMGSLHFRSGDMSVEKFNNFIKQNGYNAKNCEVLEARQAEANRKTEEKRAAEKAQKEAERIARKEEAARETARKKELLKKLSTGSVFCMVENFQEIKFPHRVVFYKVLESSVNQVPADTPRRTAIGSKLHPYYEATNLWIPPPPGQPGDEQPVDTRPSLDLKVMVGHFNSDTKEVVPETSYSGETKIFRTEAPEFEEGLFFFGRETCEQKVFAQIAWIKSYLKQAQNYKGKMGCRRESEETKFEPFKISDIWLNDQQQPIKAFEYPHVRVDAVKPDGSLQRQYESADLLIFLNRGETKWDQKECNQLVARQGMEAEF